MTKPQRILVLSVSAGAGHVRAAQAICAAAEEVSPQLSVKHLDVLELVSPAFRKLYGDSYIKLVERAPLLWALLYQQTDRRESRSLFDRLRRHVERLNTRKLESEIARFAPDAIICTHFLPAELLARRIACGNTLPPVWVQVTDFDIHGLWLQSHMQGYCVATEEVAARLAARGIERSRIHVTGIAIMPQFSRAPSRAEAAAELGIDPAKLTVLAMSGGAGVGGIENLVETAAALPRDLQIIALAGRNAELLDRLGEIGARHPGRVVALGFTRTIERAMAAADVAVTKPGGLTTSECLAMALPMIVVSPIPGQEERNADFLLESGCALKAVDAAAFAHKLAALIDAPERLAAMRERERAVARPAAARSILELVLNDHAGAR
jgi:processive 1,2-diacylglycerol beta-glucosyltransferase